MSSDAVDIMWKILISWTFGTSLVFVGYLASVSEWWKNAFSKSMMIHQIAMTIVLGFSMIVNFVGSRAQYPWVQLLGVVVFSAVPLALTWRIVVLMRIKREVRRGDVDDHNKG